MIRKLSFADEPTGNLDSKMQTAFISYSLILEIKYNQTFVIVTHNQGLAENTDRKLVMKDGQIVDGFKNEKKYIFLSLLGILLSCWHRISTLIIPQSGAIT